MAAGFDSLVVGEAQILTQVKQALHTVEIHKLSGRVLSRLFLKSYSTGREVREKYAYITNGFRNSVSSSVADLVSGKFNTDKGRKLSVFLIGSGKMAKLAVASFREKGLLRRMIVATRRSRLEGIDADRIVHVSEISRVLSEESIDIGVAASAVEEYLITNEVLEPFINTSATGKELLIFDISLPRNIDPQIVTRYKNIELIKLDDLRTHLHSFDNITAGSDQVSGELSAVRSLIGLRSGEFLSWLKENSVITPVMASLRRNAEDIRSQEVSNACSRLPDITPEQKQAIEKMSERIVRRLLDAPTSRVKELIIDGDSRPEEYVAVLKDLFSLEVEGDFCRTTGQVPK